MKHLHEAFYTTKTDGLRMGSIRRGIIEAHGGHIWADISAPREAVFYYVLPVEPTAAS